MTHVTTQARSREGALLFLKLFMPLAMFHIRAKSREEQAR